jgi:hypothetical protein
LDLPAAAGTADKPAFDGYRRPERLRARVSNLITRESLAPVTRAGIRDHNFMKPTPQISSEERDRKAFPVTDYHYQSTTEPSRAGAAEARRASPLRSIWKLSAQFFAVEATRDFAFEFCLFSLIGGLAAWPIISMLIAVVRMIRNY